MAIKCSFVREFDGPNCTGETMDDGPLFQNEESSGFKLDIHHSPSPPTYRPKPKPSTVSIWPIVSVLVILNVVCLLFVWDKTTNHIASLNAKIKYLTDEHEKLREIIRLKEEQFSKTQKTAPRKAVIGGQ